MDVIARVETDWNWIVNKTNERKTPRNAKRTIKKQRKHKTKKQ
jgi:hypothetical protein